MSDGEGPAAAGGGATEPGRHPPPDLLVLGAAVGGGAAMSAAVLVVVGILFGGMSSGGIFATIGEPLGSTVGAGSASNGLGASFDLPVGVDAALAGGSGIVVDVGGAVARPGLVRLRAGERVGDAIEAAGGFGPRADLDAAGLSLNLAQPLSDGLKVVVPELGVSGAAVPETGGGRIDINSADQAALESLPGVGPVTATKIIEARSQQPFASVEELRGRGIVGEAVFGDIEALVRASG